VFLGKLQDYAMHVHAHKWQEAQFKQNLQTLAHGEVIIDMDFSMNVTFRSHEELQSEHWTHPMASLFDAGEQAVGGGVVSGVFYGDLNKACVWQAPLPLP
jgi:hypothetical protein